MTKISVIIPVYNTQNYLNECIDSVINQSQKDIEIICIDDGSNDGSLELLNEYREKDSRVTVISQKNKGVAATRNAGLNIAKGEYILFLDSDDYLKENSLQYLYDTAINKDLDMLMFKIINFNNKTLKESHSEYFDMPVLKNIVGNDVFNWKDIKEHIFDVSVSLPSKLFKRELLSDTRFYEGLIFEDNLFFMQIIFKAQRIYFSDEYLYYRRIRPDSITNSYHDKFSDCMDIYELIINHFKDMGRYEEFHTQIFNRQCHDTFHRFKQLEDIYKNDFYQKLKEQFLNQKDTLESLGTFKDCSKRSLEIYNSAVNSNTYKEFELSIQLYDSIVKNKKYKRKISKLNKEIDSLRNSKSWKVTKVFRGIKK